MGACETVLGRYNGRGSHGSHSTGVAVSLPTSTTREKNLFKRSNSALKAEAVMQVLKEQGTRKSVLKDAEELLKLMKQRVKVKMEKENTTATTSMKKATTQTGGKSTSS